MASHRGGRVDESEVRELRTLLKSAQSDVKRYAALVVRLQQELDRERLKTATAQASQSLAGSTRALRDNQEEEDEEVDEMLKRSETTRNALRRLAQSAPRKCVACQCETQSHDAHNSGSDWHVELRKVDDVIQHQRLQIERLARENAKLRDALEKRPRHRDLARRQWQNESLQAEVARLKDKCRRIQENKLHGTEAVPVFEPASSDLFADRISMDKLLSWLHVEHKPISAYTIADGKKSRSNRRRFLKAPAECYLVLDAAAIEAACPNDTPEIDRMNKREQLSRRVGVMCSQIVASCCYSIGVYEVGKLSNHVEALYEHSQHVPRLQDFVDRVDQLTNAVVIREPPLIARQRLDHRQSESEGFLDSVASRVQDLVYEVRARREQMKPPGDTALRVVMNGMRLLDVDRITELCPAIERLHQIAETERAFFHKTRKILGLDHAASRTDALVLLQELMETFEPHKHRQRPQRKSTR